MNIREYEHSATDAEDEERAFLTIATQLFGLYSEDGEDRDRSVDAVPVENPRLKLGGHGSGARRLV